MALLAQKEDDRSNLFDEEFLKEIDRWLSDHQTEVRDTTTVRLGAGAYLIQSDT